MSRAMLRYEVPVDDRPRTFLLGATPVHIAAAQRGTGPDAQHTVEFWAEGDPELVDTWTHHRLQVFGTGHPLPTGAVWRGTTDRTPEGLVWHLYELLPGEAP